MNAKRIYTIILFLLLVFSFVHCLPDRGQALGQLIGVISSPGVPLSIEVSLSTESTVSVNESGTTATISLSLSHSPSADVTIPSIAVSNLQELSVSQESITFSKDTWDTPQEITITGVNDSIADGNSLNYITFSNTTSEDANFDDIAIEQAKVLTIDDETPGITITPSSDFTTEAGGTSTISVVLNSEPRDTVAIATITSSNTAEGTIATSSLTFTPSDWSTTQTIVVTGQNDDYQDGNVAYTIDFSDISSNDSNYNSLSYTQTLTNNDDDTAGIAVTPTSGLTVTENAGFVSFTVVLNSQPYNTVSIPVSTTAGGLSLSTSSLSFTTSNWNVAQTVQISAPDDSIQYPTGPYTVTLGTATNYNDIDADDVSVSLADNDTAALTVSTPAGNTTEAGTNRTFTVRLDTVPTSNVTVTVSSDDTTEGTVSPSTLTFTSGDWNVNQTVTITAVDDSINDGNITYGIDFSVSSSDTIYNGIAVTSLSLQNEDNEASGYYVENSTFGTGGVNNTFTGNGTQNTFGILTADTGAASTLKFKLTSEPLNNVTITFSILKNDGTAFTTDPAVVSPTTMTFTSSDWNTEQTATITGQYNGIDTFQQYRVVMVSASTDTDYNGHTLQLSDSNSCPSGGGTGKISYCKASGTFTTNEGGTTQEFYIIGTQAPTSTVTIPVYSSDTTEGTASPSSISLTSSNWNQFGTSNKVTITGANDSPELLDGDVAYSIVLDPDGATSDTYYNGYDPGDVSITNEDTDTAFDFTTTGWIYTAEDGTTANFGLRLNIQPTAGSTVRVPVSSDDTGEGTIAVTYIEFNNSNWNTYQYVTVTGVDDAIADGRQDFKIVTGTVTEPVDDPNNNFSGLDPNDVNVRNTDDEKVIFITTNSYTGNLGGITGADTKCNSDGNKPGNHPSTYKALLVDGTGSPNRRGSVSANAGDSQLDWALAASTDYFRDDGTTQIFTTDANKIFSFGTLSASFNAGSDTVWTGLDDDWTGNSTNHCTQWTNNSAVDNGQEGLSNATDDTSIDSGFSDCSMSRKLICVQQ
ncbi:MAG: DUF1554 domain-containing protein [Spirochaetota bacterium]